MRERSGRTAGSGVLGTAGALACSTLMALSCQAVGARSALGASSPNGVMDANIFVGLSKKVVPSVVNISTLTRAKSAPGAGTPDDFFRRFFEEFFRQHGGGKFGQGDDGSDEGQGGQGGNDDDSGDSAQPGGPQQHGPRAMSLGSGFIIDSSGIILTNNHVVSDADEIKITFTEALDEKPTDGQVVGRDPELDLALIKVKSKREMVALPLGDSDALEVGEYVIAVGNPFGQGHSVTHGIISAKNRLSPDFQLANYLQTDAPINPGNSGGPLVNLKGEVIGINNAIYQAAQNIGFAIPINLVKKVLPQLKSKGTVSRGYIGVLVHELTPEVAAKLGVSKDLQAPFVTHVYPGEPADRAGVKPYDVIVELDGKKIHSSSELVAAVTGVTVGESVPIKINRGGKELDLKIKVSLRPGAQLAESKKNPRENKKKKPSWIETGMNLEDVTPDVVRDLGLPEGMKGAVVVTVAYDSAADRAGLIRGDVIIEVDRKPVKSVDAFYAVVKEKKSYLLRVRRVDPQGGEAFTVVILDLKNASK